MSRPKFSSIGRTHAHIQAHIQDYCQCPPHTHFHVVKDEKQSLCRQLLEELKAVHVWQGVLAVVGRRGVGVPLEVRSAGAQHTSNTRQHTEGVHRTVQGMVGDAVRRAQPAAGT